MSYQMGWLAEKWDQEADDWVGGKWFKSARGAWSHARRLIGTVYGGIRKDETTMVDNSKGRVRIVQEMHVFK